jgi:hypothetical protein
MLTMISALRSTDIRRSSMRRERIARTASRRPRRSIEVLPIDPRDPDIVRAKAIEQREARRSRRDGRPAA